MRPDEVSTLLDNIDGNAILDIEYSLPNYGELIIGMPSEYFQVFKFILILLITYHLLEEIKH